MNFDPATFLTQETTDSLEKRPPLPAADYSAIINNIEAKPWQSKDGTKSGMKFDVTLKVDVPLDVKTQLNLSIDQLTLTDGIMLDLNAQGMIDYSVGKNNKLRQYREAVGMNKKGEPFSPQRMIGQPLRVKIGHEEYNGNLLERVQAVAGV